MLKSKPWLSSHQKLLSLQFQQQQLPHAILINGVTGAGKAELANWLIQLINCKQPVYQDNDQQILYSCGQCKTCLLSQSNTLPDHLNLLPEKNSLGIDEIRSANSFLQKTAQIGAYKTVLISQADNMTPAAANALLKTLEEPSPYSVLVLVSNEVESLLPTIVSRCRIFHIQTDVGKSLLSNLASQNHINTDVFNPRYVNLTQLPELTDEKVLEAFLAFKQLYFNFLYHQQDELSLLQQILDNEYALRWLEQITVNLQREQLVSQLKNNNEQLKIASNVLNQLYKTIINASKEIKSYTQSNRQFIIQQLVMSLSQIIEQTHVDKQEHRFDTY